MTDELEDNFEDGDEESLTESEIEGNISNYSSIKLCDIIITYRYIGMFKDLYKLCMEELGNRRAAGDDFDFEKYIESNLIDMPKIEFNISNLSDAIDNMKKWNMK